MFFVISSYLIQVPLAATPAAVLAVFQIMQFRKWMEWAVPTIIMQCFNSNPSLHTRRPEWFTIKMKTSLTRLISRRLEWRFAIPLRRITSGSLARAARGPVDLNRRSSSPSPMWFIRVPISRRKEQHRRGLRLGRHLHLHRHQDRWSKNKWAKS